jgi:hypothetical protein
MPHGAEGSLANASGALEGAGDEMGGYESGWGGKDRGGARGGV